MHVRHRMASVVDTSALAALFASFEYLFYVSTDIIISVLFQRRGRL